MRSLSQQLLAWLPAMMALFLVFLIVAPMGGSGVNYAPNVAWLMTLVMVAFYPPAWPRGIAFLLGLLQDMLFGTPLGSQALLALMLAQLVAVQTHRHQVQLFRMRWLEAAGMLLLWHVLLWALMHLIQTDAPSLSQMVSAGVVNALWYPVVYGVVTRMFSALPDAK